MLVEVGAALDATGVEFLALKGVATGHLDHQQPGLRQAADMDVLVRLADFDRRKRARRRELSPTPTPPWRSWTRARPGTLPSATHSTSTTDRTPPGAPSASTGGGAASPSVSPDTNSVRSIARGGWRTLRATSPLSYPNHRILSSLLDLIVISRLASDAERAGAERFLSEVGVSDLVHRITTRAAALVDDERIVVGRPGGRPLDVALRRAYDRPDLDKVAMKPAKTFGMPLASRMRVLHKSVAPSEEFLEHGGYASGSQDRVSQVFRRLRLRRSKS